MAKKALSRYEQLQEDAERLKLYVRKYSPGDGVTRYRFMRKKVSYFADDGVFTALGIGQAETWLAGYRRRR
jgi:hypothetical protein